MSFRTTAARLRKTAVLALATATLSTMAASGTIAQAAPVAPASPDPGRSAKAEPRSLVHEDKRIPSARKATRSAAAMAAPSCAGDGVSGPRIQLMYVRGDRQPDRLEGLRGQFMSRATQMNSRFVTSSEAMGERREVRFVHDSSCTPTVTRVVIPQGAMDAGSDAAVNAVKAAGHDRNDRKYVLWTENDVCGLGYGFAHDKRPGQDNHHNVRAGHPMIGLKSTCFANPDVDTHELLHTMGAVQPGAPGSTANGHCYIRGDLMCYNDGGIPNPPGDMIGCRNPGEAWIDCNRDSYFNPRPQPGSYLDRNWNIANSAFLIRGDSAGQVPGTARLLSAVGGWAADVDNANTADGTRVKAEYDTGHAAQRWNLTRQADNRYRITPSIATGKALDSNTDRGRVVDGTSYFAQIWNYSGSDNQKWSLREVAGGRYEIVGNDGGCLTAGSYGKVLGVWNCTGSDHQRWKLAP
ncbi:RICIN domain-containing protein [Streptomyces jumonjinensis]|uniref:RICIN domain-containing protein n=1 Tax=Streptomyces jumonjinensis TaxID=1945 RepID=UPI00378CE40D